MSNCKPESSASLRRVPIIKNARPPICCAIVRAMSIFSCVVFMALGVGGFERGGHGAFGGMIPAAFDDERRIQSRVIHGHAQRGEQGFRAVAEGLTLFHAARIVGRVFAGLAAAFPGAGASLEKLLALFN